VTSQTESCMHNYAWLSHKTLTLYQPYNIGSLVKLHTQYINSMITSITLPLI